MSLPYTVQVLAKYGAPMGRHSDPIGELSGEVRLHRVPMVNGDYDPGGAYWGGYPAAPLWCAWNDEFVCYFRARDRAEAKAHLPKGTRLYR